VVVENPRIESPARQRREGFIFRDLLRFYVVDVARLPYYQGGIKGILANPTTKEIFPWAFAHGYILSALRGLVHRKG